MEGGWKDALNHSSAEQLPEGRQGSFTAQRGCKTDQDKDHNFVIPKLKSERH